jgi:hypothetical protein
MPWLGRLRQRSLCPKERGLYPPRQLNRSKPLRRVKVVLLPALVDDPQVALSDRFLIRHDAIDLVQLRRSWIPGVLDADYELGSRAFLAVRERAARRQLLRLLGGEPLVMIRPVRVLIIGAR